LVKFAVISAHCKRPTAAIGPTHSARHPDGLGRPLIRNIGYISPEIHSQSGLFSGQAANFARGICRGNQFPHPTPVL